MLTRLTPGSSLTREATCPSVSSWDTRSNNLT
jgi:hypothetical protein